MRENPAPCSGGFFEHLQWRNGGGVLIPRGPAHAPNPRSGRRRGTGVYSGTGGGSGRAGATVRARPPWTGGDPQQWLLTSHHRTPTAIQLQLRGHHHMYKRKKGEKMLPWAHDQDFLAAFIPAGEQKKSGVNARLDRPAGRKIWSIRARGKLELWRQELGRGRNSKICSATCDESRGGAWKRRLVVGVRGWRSREAGGGCDAEGGEWREPLSTTAGPAPRTGGGHPVGWGKREWVRTCWHSGGPAGRSHRPWACMFSCCNKLSYGIDRDQLGSFNSSMVMMPRVGKERPCCWKIHACIVHGIVQKRVVQTSRCTVDKVGICCLISDHRLFLF